MLAAVRASVRDRVRGMSRPNGERRTLQADRQRLERAAELYLQHCYRSRTAARADEFAARYLGYDRSHLSRLASAALGMPLGEYLRRRQLARAEVLLRTTPLTIDAIAAASGFGTPWSFYRQFQRAYGMTPGAYRTQATK